MTTISALPTAPSRADPATFSDRSDALLGALDTFVTETNTVVTEVNALAAAMGSLASGAATSIPYTFSTTTTDSDPGAGILRLDNATQNAATTIRVDLVGSDGSTWTSLLDTFDDSTSTIKGFIMLQKASDATKWLLFSVSALASPSGYKNITVANVASSAASPFANADALLLKFTRNGDKGETGATGATGAAGANGTNGTGALVANIVTATTATTLTSTPTLLKITPASYGVAVTLPDATTCNLGGPLHIIDNKGAYPVRVLNSAGTLLGFVYGGVVSHVSLSDKSTAAGVWTIENNELVGASAQLLVADTFVSFTSSSAVSVELGAGRELLLASAPSYLSGNLYGVVYDSATNIFGTVTLIRGADIRGNYSLAVVANNSVLVVSCVNNNTALEAVVLSISGTTITVNTAATATLSANFSSFADGCGLIAVGSSFVTSYTVATPAAQIRALSISGTTVTIGSATVLSGASASHSGLMAASGSVVLVTDAYASGLRVQVYTVSGSTLSAGTKYENAYGALGIQRRFFPLGNRWVVLWDDVSNLQGTVISLSGTTATGTNVNLNMLGSVGTLLDAIVVGSNKVLLLSSSTSNNANILTDTAGTASAGTAITLSSQTTRACLYASGTDVAVQEGTTTYLAHMVDCSGASPVLTKTITTGGSSVEAAAFSASNAVLSRSPKAVYGTAYARNVWMSAVTQNFDPEINGGVFRRREHTNVPGDNTSPGAAYRGKSASEIWIADATTVITKIECVQ